jgi:hypothetical protein
MAQPTIDSAKPGKSTDSDQFKNPHGTAQGPSGSGSGRDSGGRYQADMSYGGESPDGDAMVEKYKPKGSSSHINTPEDQQDELKGSDWD